MEHRVTLTIGVVALLVLMPVIAMAQATEPADAPRTPWGDPDLQGVWDYSTITPMQRPERYGDQAYLTEEEAAALEQGAVERDQNAAAAPARRAEAGENVGAYNLFWMDLGTQVVEDRRTSLLIDPPNGRFPAMTEAGAAEASTRRGFGADLAGRLPRGSRLGRPLPRGARPAARATAVQQHRADLPDA